MWYCVVFGMVLGALSNVFGFEDVETGYDHREEVESQNVRKHYLPYSKYQSGTVKIVQSEGDVFAEGLRTRSRNGGEDAASIDAVVLRRALDVEIPHLSLADKLRLAHENPHVLVKVARAHLYPAYKGVHLDNLDEPQYEYHSEIDVLHEGQDGFDEFSSAPSRKVSKKEQAYTLVRREGYRPREVIVNEKGKSPTVSSKERQSIYSGGEQKRSRQVVPGRRKDVFEEIHLDSGFVLD